MDISSKIRNALQCEAVETIALQSMSVLNLNHEYGNWLKSLIDRPIR